MTKVFDVKKMLYGGLIFFVLLLFAGTTVSAASPIIVGFTANHTSGSAPFSVGFTDQTTGSLPTGWA